MAEEVQQVAGMLADAASIYYQVSPRVIIMLGVCVRRGRPRHPYRV
jgi:hypothetical protein